MVNKSKITILILLFVTVAGCFALTIDDLNSSMLSNNLAIKKAKEEINKASLDISDAKSGYAPTIDLTVTGSYIANPIDPIRVNLADYISTPVAGLTNDYVTVYQGQENMYYQFSLSMTQPIYTWGKLDNAVRIYQKVYDVKVLQLQDIIEQNQTELRTRVAAVYYLNEIKSLLEQQTSITQRLVELAEEASSNGMMLATEALGVKVQARQIDVALSKIEQQLQLMQTALRNLTGIKDLSIEDLEFNEESFDYEVESLISIDFDSLSAKVLSDNRTNFKLLAELGSISSLTKDIANASVNWKPDFALVVNADYSGSRLPLLETDWYGKADWSATITVALKTTIFDGGKALRNVQKASSDVKEASIDLDYAKQVVAAALDENWTNLYVYLAQIEYQKALKMQLEEQYSVDKKVYDTGYGSEADCLKTLLECNNAELEILQTKINLATAVNALLYLEGK